MQPLILTNGHFFNDRFFEIIAPYKPRIRVSLDGASETDHDYMRGVGAFKKTIKGIETLQSNSYEMNKVEVFCTLRPGREEMFNDILEICQTYGIRTIKAEPIAKTGRARENWPEKTDTTDFKDIDHRSFGRFFNENSFADWKVREIKDFKFSTLTIYSNGDVYPYVYYNDEDKTLALLGNIETTSYQDILDANKIHKALVFKILTAYRGGERGLLAKVLTR